MITALLCSETNTDTLRKKKKLKNTDILRKLSSIKKTKRHFEKKTNTDTLKKKH